MHKLSQNPNLFRDCIVLGCLSFLENNRLNVEIISNSGFWVFKILLKHILWMCIWKHKLEIWMHQRDVHQFLFPVAFLHQLSLGKAKATASQRWICKICTTPKASHLISILLAFRVKVRGGLLCISKVWPKCTFATGEEIRAVSVCWYFLTLSCTNRNARVLEGKDWWTIFANSSRYPSYYNMC